LFIVVVVVSKNFFRTGFQCLGVSAWRDCLLAAGCILAVAVALVRSIAVAVAQSVAVSVAVAVAFVFAIALVL